MLLNKKSIFALLAAGLAVTTAQLNVPDCVTACLANVPDVKGCLSQETATCLCDVIKLHHSTLSECINTTCNPTDASTGVQLFDQLCPGTDKPTSTKPTSTHVSKTVVTKDTKTTTAVPEVTEAQSSVVTEDVEPTSSVVTEDVEPTSSVVTEDVEPTTTGNSTVSVTGHVNTTMVTSTQATSAPPTIETSTGGVEGRFTGIHSGLFAALAAAAAMFAL